MAFLFGDSSPSPLTSNFLEFLRDALDFCVFVLSSDEQIQEGRRRSHEHRLAADAETERLEIFGRTVTAAIHDAGQGDPASQTSLCAAELLAKTSEAVASATDAVQAHLRSRLAQAEAEEAAERDASFKALEALLLSHAPPEARLARYVELQSDGSYAARLVGVAEMGLTWQVALKIPAQHAFASAAPMGVLAPLLEFHAPGQTGWLKKEVKLLPQRLDRLVLTEAFDDGVSVHVKLRALPGTDDGFDASIEVGSSLVQISRTGTKEGVMAGPFDLPAEDVPKLASLASRLRESLGELAGERLTEAALGVDEYRTLPEFAMLVRLLVTSMAPIVHQIAQHSANRGELVIRRLLSDDRREEIFVAKSTLCEKYAAVSRRALFDPLGLGTLPPPPPSALEEAFAPEEVRVGRSELARSQPPPPRRSSMPPAPDAH